MQTTTLPTPPSLSAPTPGSTLPKTHLLNERLRSAAPWEALHLFDEMTRRGTRWNKFTFPPLLRAAWKTKAIEEGKIYHGLLTKLGFGRDVFIETGLVRMYVGCGRVREGRLVFDRMGRRRDVIAWNAMIDGCCQSGLLEEAIGLFEEMQSCNVKPDEMLLSTVVSACGRAGNLSYGKMIHEYIMENDITLDSHLQTALISMYANSGCMDLARELFDQMTPKSLVISTSMVSWYSKVGQLVNARAIFDELVDKDVVCWSAMISCYAESDYPLEAITLFKEMIASGMKPDQVTILSVVSACSHLGALDKAQWIHRYIDEHGFWEAVPVNNALIDMYAKCGYLSRAQEVFKNMRFKNVITWTSMISSCAMHGDADTALSLFNQMKDENVEPNEVTYIGALYACSHAGLVDKGREIFSSMVNERKMTPKHEHYGCLVDLLCRANLFREALEVIETMPLAPNVVIWGSLMSACLVHNEIDLGEFAAKQVLKLDPDHDGALVVLSNIFAKEGRWDDVGELRRSMRERGIYKERGNSRIELNDRIHEFHMADRGHEDSDRIYEKLDEVVDELKRLGYAPSSDDVLVDLEDDEKRQVILWHSEKLALCFGLLNQSQGSCIRIVKNLRTCEDCHKFMKLVSKAYRVEIIVRDRTRFHHCKDGACSCKDYW